MSELEAKVENVYQKDGTVNNVVPNNQETTTEAKAEPASQVEAESDQHRKNIDKWSKEKENYRKGLSEKDKKIQELEGLIESQKIQAMKEKEDFKGLYEASQAKVAEYEAVAEREKLQRIEDKKMQRVEEELLKLGLNQDRIAAAKRLVDLKKVAYKEDYDAFEGHELMAKSIKDLSPEWFGKTSAKVATHGVDPSGQTFTMEHFKKSDNKKDKMQQAYEAMGIPTRQ